VAPAPPPTPPSGDESGAESEFESESEYESESDDDDQVPQTRRRPHADVDSSPRKRRRTNTYVYVDAINEVVPATEPSQELAQHTQQLQGELRQAMNGDTRQMYMTLYNTPEKRDQAVANAVVGIKECDLKKQPLFEKRTRMMSVLVLAQKGMSIPPGLPNAHNARVSLANATNQLNNLNKKRAAFTDILKALRPDHVLK